MVASAAQVHRMNVVVENAVQGEEERREGALAVDDDALGVNDDGLTVDDIGSGEDNEAVLKSPVVSKKKNKSASSIKKPTMPAVPVSPKPLQKSGKVGKAVRFSLDGEPPTPSLKKRRESK